MATISIGLSQLRLEYVANNNGELINSFSQIDDTSSNNIVNSTDEDHNSVKLGNTSSSYILLPASEGLKNDVNYINTSTDVNTITMEVWLKYTGSVNGDDEFETKTENSSLGWVLGWDGSNTGPNITLNDSGVNTDVFGNYNIGCTPNGAAFNDLTNGTSGNIKQLKNELLHIVGYWTYTNNALQRGIYVNGTLYNQQSDTGSNIEGLYRSNLEHVSLCGKWLNENNEFETTNKNPCPNTQIYSTRIWSKLLTQTEVDELYAYGPNKQLYQINFQNLYNSIDSVYDFSVDSNDNVTPIQSGKYIRNATIGDNGVTNYDATKGAYSFTRGTQSSSQISIDNHIFGGGDTTIEFTIMSDGSAGNNDIICFSQDVSNLQINVTFNNLDTSTPILEIENWSMIEPDDRKIKYRWTGDYSISETWVNFCIVLDAISVPTLYINGSPSTWSIDVNTNDSGLYIYEKSDSTIAQPIFHPNEMYPTISRIGNSTTDDNNGFSGYLKNLRIFNKKLTTDEITYLYNTTSIRDTANVDPSIIINTITDSTSIINKLQLNLDMQHGLEGLQGDTIVIKNNAKFQEKNAKYIKAFQPSTNLIKNGNFIYGEESNFNISIVEGGILDSAIFDPDNGSVTNITTASIDGYIRTSGTDYYLISSESMPGGTDFDMRLNLQLEHQEATAAVIELSDTSSFTNLYTIGFDGAGPSLFMQGWESETIFYEDSSSVYDTSTPFQFVMKLRSGQLSFFYGPATSGLTETTSETEIFETRPWDTSSLLYARFRPWRCDARVYDWWFSTSIVQPSFWKASDNITWNTDNTYTQNSITISGQTSKTLYQNIITVSGEVYTCYFKAALYDSGELLIGIGPENTTNPTEETDLQTTYTISDTIPVVELGTSNLHTVSSYGQFEFTFTAQQQVSRILFSKTGSGSIFIQDVKITNDNSEEIHNKASNIFSLSGIKLFVNKSEVNLQNKITLTGGEPIKQSGVYTNSSGLADSVVNITHHYNITTESNYETMINGDTNDCFVTNHHRDGAGMLIDLESTYSLDKIDALLLETSTQSQHTILNEYMRGVVVQILDENMQILDETQIPSDFSTTQIEESILIEYTKKHLLTGEYVIDKSLGKTEARGTENISYDNTKKAIKLFGDTSGGILDLEEIHFGGSSTIRAQIWIDTVTDSSNILFKATSDTDDNNGQIMCSFDASYVNITLTNNESETSEYKYDYNLSTIINSWLDIIITFNVGSPPGLYINGIAALLFPSTNTITAPSLIARKSVHIGDVDQGLFCYLKEFQIFHKALTTSEINYIQSNPNMFINTNTEYENVINVDNSGVYTNILVNNDYINYLIDSSGISFKANYNDKPSIDIYYDVNNIPTEETAQLIDSSNEYIYENKTLGLKEIHYIKIIQYEGALFNNTDDRITLENIVIYENNAKYDLSNNHAYLYSSSNIYGEGYGVENFFENNNAFYTEYDSTNSFLMIQLSTPINLDLLNFINLYEFTDSSSVGLGGLRIQLFDEKQSMIDERQIPLNRDVLMSFDFKNGMTNLGSDNTVATLVGGATQNTSGVTFDGVDGYVKFTNYTNFYGALTLNVVFKLNDLDDWQRIIDFDSETNKTSAAGNGGSFCILVTSNNARVWYNVDYYIDFPVVIDTYYNVTVVFDDVNDNMIVYVDGVKIGEVSIPDGGLPPEYVRTDRLRDRNFLTLGYSESNEVIGASDPYFDGEITTFTLWNKGLSDSEVYELIYSNVEANTSYSSKNYNSLKIEYNSNYWSLVTSLTNIDYNNPWTGTDLLGNPDPNIHFTLSDYSATNGQDLEIWFNIGLTTGEIVNKYYKGFDLSFAFNTLHPAHDSDFYISDTSLGTNTLYYKYNEDDDWVSVDPSCTDTAYWNTNDNFREETSNQTAHNDSNYTFQYVTNSNNWEWQFLSNQQSAQAGPLWYTNNGILFTNDFRIYCDGHSNTPMEYVNVYSNISLDASYTLTADISNILYKDNITFNKQLLEPTKIAPAQNLVKKIDTFFDLSNIDFDNITSLDPTIYGLYKRTATFVSKENIIYNDVNGALDFSGGYIDLTPKPYGGGPVTLSFCLNMSNHDFTSYPSPTLFNTGISNTNIFKIDIVEIDSSFAALQISDTTQTTLQLGSISIQDFVHISLVFTEDTTTLYKNGVFDESGNFSYPTYKSYEESNLTQIANTPMLMTSFNFTTSANDNGTSNSSLILNGETIRDNNGIYFDGTTNMFAELTIPDFGGDTSISTVFKAEHHDTQATIFEFSYTSNVANEAGLSLSWNSNNQLEVVYGRWGTESVILSDSASLIEGQYYHIVATFSSTHIKLYLNGTIDNSNSLVGAGGLVETTRENALLGCSYDGTTYSNAMKGTIKSFEIWNRVLNDDDILALYNDISNSLIDQSPIENFDFTSSLNNLVNNRSDAIINGTVIQDTNGATFTSSSDNNITLYPGSFGGDTSISIVFKINTHVNNQRLFHFGGSSTSTWNNLLVEFMENGGPYRIRINESNTIDKELNSTLNEGVYYNVIFTVSSYWLKIYVNGTLDSSTAITSSLETGTRELHYLGRPTPSSYDGYFDGIIKSFTLWDRSITETEVVAFYNDISNTLVDDPLLNDASLCNFDFSALVNVTSISHPNGTNDGTYFLYDTNEWTTVFGTVNSDDALVTFVYQIRNGVVIRSGDVKTWNNHNGPNGRYDSGGNSGDWEVGDFIVPLDALNSDWNITLYGGVTQTTDGLTFNGVDGYLLFDNFSDFGGEVTIDVVFKLSDWGKWQRIVDFDSAGGIANNYSFFIAQNNENEEITVRQRRGNQDYDITFPVVLETFYRITTKFVDGEGMYVYINGEYYGYNSSGGFLNSPPSGTSRAFLSLGISEYIVNYSGTNSPLNGVIKSFTMWETALTDTEILYYVINDTLSESQIIPYTTPSPPSSAFYGSLKYFYLYDGEIPSTEVKYIYDTHTNSNYSILEANTDDYQEYTWTLTNPSLTTNAYLDAVTLYVNDEKQSNIGLYLSEIYDISNSVEKLIDNIYTTHSTSQTMYCDISSNSTLQIKFFAKYGDTTKVELALWHNFTNSTIETWQNAPIVLTDNVGNILYSTTLPSTLEYWNDKRQIFEHTIKDDEFNKTNPSNLGDVSHSTIETNKVVFLG